MTANDEALRALTRQVFAPDDNEDTRLTIREHGTPEAEQWARRMLAPKPTTMPTRMTINLNGDNQ